MRKFFVLNSIQVVPVSFDRLEVIIGGHFGIQLDRCVSVFI